MKFLKNINNMENLLKVPSTITKVTTMSDNGLRIQVDTMEIQPQEAGMVMMLKNKTGYFLFSEQAPKIEDIDLPEIKTDKGQKTESQRLRAVLYRVWEKKGKQGNSDQFYKNYMDRVINKLKEEL